MKVGKQRVGCFMEYVDMKKDIIDVGIVVVLLTAELKIRARHISRGDAAQISVDK